MSASESPRKSVAVLLDEQQGDILEAWLEQIRLFAESRGLTTPADPELRRQKGTLLRALTQALYGDNVTDLGRPEFAESLGLLRDLSREQAELGLTPIETASYVLTLQDALLPFLQQAYGDDPGFLNATLIGLNRLINQLALTTLEAFVAMREEVIMQQSEVLLELSTPVLSLWDEMVLMPVIGVVDTVRAAQLMERLLRAIVEAQARVAILDITGVPVVDSRVARSLIDTVSAARLLGAEVIVTGIGPEAAQTLTRLRIDLSRVRTRNTLQAGVAEAFTLLHKQTPDGRVP